ncbi:hypothetical protein WME89_02190 [Sorangium sp. So ce321]
MAQRGSPRLLRCLFLLRVTLRALLLGRLLALKLGGLLALLLSRLLAELGALLLPALLSGLLTELGALLLGRLLAELGTLQLPALLSGLLAKLGALLLPALLLSLQLGALQLPALLSGLLAETDALLLTALLSGLLTGLGALLLSALLRAGLLLSLLQQRTEHLLGLPHVLLDALSQRRHVRPEPRVSHALDDRFVEEIEGMAVQGDLRPDEGHVELCAFLVLQRFIDLGGVGPELLAARARLDVRRGAARQLRPVLLGPGVLVDHLLGVALHLRGLGLVPGDLRQLDLLLVDERDQRHDLPIRRLLHHAVTAGVSAALPAALVAGVSAALPAALVAGVSAALPAALVAGVSAALPAALLAAYLRAARALSAAALPAALVAGVSAAPPVALSPSLPAARARRAVSACPAAAPAVSARVVPAGALAAGRRLAVRLGLIDTADAAAGPREYKAPREHDRHEAT